MGNIVNTQLGRIEYTDIGTGTSMVFLHGGHSNCRVQLFHKGFDKKRFRLITPSRPGYGHTPLNGYEKPEDAARLIASFLELFNDDKIIVIGISAGGPTAISLVALLKDKVRALVLISAVSKRWLTKMDGRFLLSRLLFHPIMEGTTWKLVHACFRLFPRSMAKTFFNEFSTNSSVEMTQKEILALKKMISLQRSGRGFLNDLGHELDTKVLEAVECPTLIMHSMNDASVNVDMAYHAYGHIANAELKLYNNRWGHLLWLGRDSAQPINDANRFLRQL